MKIPEPGDEAEAGLWTTRIKKEHIRRVEGWLHPDCIAPPPGQHREAPRGPPQSCGFSSGQREPQVDTQLLQCYRKLPGRPLQVLLYGDHWGNLWGLTGGSVRGREGVGLTATSTQILADSVPVCSVTQAEIPASSSARFQGGAVWPGSSLGTSVRFGSRSVGRTGWSTSYRSAWTRSSFSALPNC